MQGKTLGAYRTLREIGRGGMGSVYLAEHLLLGRHAAVKVLLPEYSANRTIVTRFFNEARAAAAIRHLGIVEVYDFGYSDDNQAYIAMEYLQGESLSARIARGQMAPTAALTVARQIAGPLAAAHRAGIVHRDLKPDNIHIVPDEEAAGGERVKLLDFGVAKLLGELGGRDQTHSGAIVGTPNYMSPEQCRGVAVDHRADLYALGCILYKLLTGKAPFRGEGPGDVMMAHVYQPAPVPSTEQAGIDPAIDELVARLLAKRPDDRFQRAEEVVQAIDACAATLARPRPVVPQLEPTAPRPPGHAAGTITSASHAAAVAMPVPVRRGRLLAIGGSAAAVTAIVATAVLAGGTGGGDDGGRSATPAAMIDAGQPALIDAAADAPVALSADADADADADAGAIAPPPPTDAAAAAVVAISIETTPRGAQVSLDGHVVGTTPLAITWPRGEHAVAVVVRLAGYRTERFDVVPADDLDKPLTLHRAVVRPPNPFE